MRIAMFMTVAIALHLPAKAISQNEKLNLHEQNIRLDTFLHLLEKKTAYRFTYSLEAIPADKRISVEANKEPVLSILDRVLATCGLSYRVLQQRTIVIIPAAGSAGSNLSGVPSFTVLLAARDTLRGVVHAADGTLLEGASVMVKGAGNGSTTDAQGNFLLHNVAGASTLFISHVGYENKEFQLNGQTFADIVLSENLANLNDVVVVGYNSQKRSSLTGSLVTVSSKDIQNGSYSNPLQSLEGKAPGLRISQGSGEPGNENISMTIRGPNSFATDNSPLVLVNGVVGNIQDLDPNFIESVTVLKDASSAAIYGARASNGVILVTTKNGSELNKLTVQYNGSYISQSRINMPKRVWNSFDYMNLRNTAVNNGGGGSFLYGADTIALYKSPSDEHPSFNWEHYMFHPINIVNHSLTVGGRSGNTNYQAAMGVWNQDGIVRGFDYKKYTAMFNLESQVGKKLKLGITTNGIVDNQKEPFNGTADQVLSTLAQIPDAKPTLSDGSGNYAGRAWAFEGPQKNPLATTSAGGAWTGNFKFNGTAYTRFNILSNLVWEVKGGMFYTENNQKQQTPVIPIYDYQTKEFYKNLNDNNTISLSERNTRTAYYTIYSTLNYHATIAKDLQLNALAGISQENSTTSYLYGYRYGFASNNLDVLNAGGGDGQTAQGDETQYSLRSQFGKLNLNYRDKYLVEGDFRRDGSSRFPPANKYAFFPSVSAGWRISNENFIRSNLHWLSDLKLRASIGQMGNDNVNGNYPYQNVISTGLDYPFSSLQGGVHRSNLANDRLKWEQTSIRNIGLDFNINRSMLYGSVDYFLKKTSGILRQQQLPGYAGVGSPYVNEGEVDNKGYEIIVGHKGSVNRFNYGVEFNISGYRNKLVKFGAPEYGSTSMMKENYEMNRFYLYQADGIYQSQDDIDKGPTSLFLESPGDVRIKDVNGDGKITPEDRMDVGGANPNFYYGLNLFANWKGFDATVFFQGEQGQKVLMNGEYTGVLPFAGGTSILQWWENGWTPENHSNTIPRMNYYYGPNGASTRATTTFWLLDRSYARLKHVAIGYSLPAPLIRKIAFSKIRIFVSADNVITFTKFQFGDPESGGQLSYPMMRSLSVGLNIQF